MSDVLPPPARPDFRVRVFEFARCVLAFCLTPPAGVHSDDVRHQLRNAATSVGAHVEEAKAAQSKRDFLAKMSIALKEAREAHYWLRVLRAHPGRADPELDHLVNECDQIVAILTATVKTTRARLAAEEAERNAKAPAKGRRR